MLFCYFTFLILAPAAVQATAFTVNFGDQDEKPKKKPPVLSSQDVQQKRFTRRSLPTHKSGPNLPAASSGDETKHYLFSKMIQGYPEGHEEDDNRPIASMSMKDLKHEVDTISEAGTYVIGKWFYSFLCKI